jgi:hypothetical protein
MDQKRKPGIFLNYLGQKRANGRWAHFSDKIASQEGARGARGAREWRQLTPEQKGLYRNPVSRGQERGEQPVEQPRHQQPRHQPQQQTSSVSGSTVVHSRKEYKKGLHGRKERKKNHQRQPHWLQHCESTLADWVPWSLPRHQMFVTAYVTVQKAKNAVTMVMLMIIFRALKSSWQWVNSCATISTTAQNDHTDDIFLCANRSGWACYKNVWIL